MAEYERKENTKMSMHIENVALLYLLNQDTKNLSLDELYSLYRKTLDQVHETEKRYQDSHKQDPFSFD